MIISVASGKGGTGKTTVAASLALSVNNSNYIDCDVEEPNGHLLLNPEIFSIEEAVSYIPYIDKDKCTICGKCVEVCEFNALVNLKYEIVLFEEMCHSCGACTYFCPSKAIVEKEKKIGIVRYGIHNNGLHFTDGIMDVGEVSAPSLIKKVKENIKKDRINIIDSPPGTSCSMVETIKESDYCILVTESTPFGLNDLKLAADVVKSIKIPFGVVINKYNPRYKEMESYLAESGIDVLMKIDFRRDYAEYYSRGILPVKEDSLLKDQFLSLFESINKRIEKNSGK